MATISKFQGYLSHLRDLKKDKEYLRTTIDELNKEWKQLCIAIAPLRQEAKLATAELQQLSKQEPKQPSVPNRFQTDEFQKDHKKRLAVYRQQMDKAKSRSQKANKALKEVEAALDEIDKEWRQAKKDLTATYKEHHEVKEELEEFKEAHPKVQQQLQQQPRFVHKIQCMRCGVDGHVKRDCDAKVYCTLCKKPGHADVACFKAECPTCGDTGHGTLRCTKPKCFSCGDWGHWAKYCTTSCIRCKQEGHHETDCPLPPPSLNDRDEYPRL